MILITKNENEIRILDLEKAEAIIITREKGYYLDTVFPNWRFIKPIDIKDEHVEVLTQYFSIMKNKEAIEDLQKLLEKLR